MAARRIVVVGAGIMGLWSALRLREAGHDVLLLDAWGVAHSRATSGDESRVIRCGYGGARLYASWAVRSLAAWAAWQKARGRTVLTRCGVLWMVARAAKEPYAGAALEDLRAVGVPHERLDRAALSRRYPQIRAAGIRWALLEPESGSIAARAACLELLADFLERGGVFRMMEVAGGSALAAGGRRLGEVRSTSGERVPADQILFACGPWLTGLFPSLIGPRLRVTHKEVFYFGTPSGDDRFSAARLPIWMELGTDCYGLPAMDGKGFKLHPDLPGRRVDPTSLERRTSTRFLAMARAALARRFPAMAGAPVVETRVCQYECTADDHMIFDRHPSFDNVWIVGGGSGHCFKHGPVIGEMVAEAMHHDRAAAIPKELRLSHAPRGRHF